MKNDEMMAFIMKCYFYGISCLIFLLALGGCAPKSADRAEIRTGSPVVHVYPVYGEYHRAKVLVLPFQVPPELDAVYGKRVAALFHEVLLAKRAFQTVKLGDRHYGNRAEAVEMGLEAEVDLVVAGRINYAMGGGQLGGSRVDVSLRVIGVKNGDTVWFISQVMDQLMAHPDQTFITRMASIFTLPKMRTSTGASVVPNMLAHIAVDMCDVIAGAEKVGRIKN